MQIYRASLHGNLINLRKCLHIIRVEFDQAPQDLRQKCVTVLVLHLPLPLQEPLPQVVQGLARLL